MASATYVRGGIWIQGGGRGVCWFARPVGAESADLDALQDPRRQREYFGVGGVREVSTGTPVAGQMFVLSQGVRTRWVYMPFPLQTVRAAGGTDPGIAGSSIPPALASMALEGGTGQITAEWAGGAFPADIPSRLHTRLERREALPLVDGAFVRAVAHATANYAGGVVMSRAVPGVERTQTHRTDLPGARRGLWLIPRSVPEIPAWLGRGRPSLIVINGGQLQLSLTAGGAFAAAALAGATLTIQTGSVELVLTGGSDDRRSGANTVTWRRNDAAVREFLNAHPLGLSGTLTFSLTTSTGRDETGELVRDHEVREGMEITYVEIGQHNGAPQLILGDDSPSTWQSVVGTPGSPLPVSVAVLFEDGTRYVFPSSRLAAVDDTTAEQVAWRGAGASAAWDAGVAAMGPGGKIALLMYPDGGLPALPAWDPIAVPDQDETVDGLDGDSAHSFRAADVNVAGTGPARASFAFANNPEAPAPRRTRVAVGNSRAYASWTGDVDPGEQLSELQLQHRERERDEDGMEVGHRTLVRNFLGDRYPVETGLANDRAARFRVRAVGGGGVAAGPETAVTVGRSKLGFRLPEDTDENPDGSV